jgi:peptide/nickel transport system ATP-binding protein
VILEIRDLRVYFPLKRGSVKAVDGVSMDVEKAEIVGLAGESGSGKSTVGYSILRIIPPPGKTVGGQIRFEGEDLLVMPEPEFSRRIRWKKISMVFQGSMSSFTPVYTIGYQLAETLRLHGYEGDPESRMVELMKMVRLDPSLLRKYPHELSGGQKQRAFIAMAIALNPELLIADEPTTALDVVSQMSILNLLKSLKRDYGLSVIFITHDLALLSEIADRVYIMYAGKVVEGGASERIYKTPKHPYTKALLASVPSIDKAKLEGIPGFMPDLVDPPRGCRFHPRCPFAMEVCRRDEPKVKSVGGDQDVACWLY